MNVVIIDLETRKPRERDAIGIVYTVGIPRQVYFDDSWKQFMTGINQALPNSVNAISSLDREEKLGVVVFYSSQQPPQFCERDEAETPHPTRYLA